MTLEWSAQARDGLEALRDGLVILNGAQVAALKIKAIAHVAMTYASDPSVKVSETVDDQGIVYKIVPCPHGYLFVIEETDHSIVVAFARDDEMRGIKTLLETPKGKPQ